MRFRDEDHTVEVLSLEALRGVDLALVSAGASVSRRFIPQAAAAGTTCIDNSSAFRMDPLVPLSIPEVNPEALEGSPTDRRRAQLHDDRGDARASGRCTARRGCVRSS